LNGKRRFDGRREATLRDRIDRENEHHPVNAEVFVFFDRSDRASRPAFAGRPVEPLRFPFNLCCSVSLWLCRSLRRLRSL